MNYSESTFMTIMNRGESSYNVRVLEKVPLDFEQMKVALENEDTAIELFCSALKSSKGREYLFKTYHINALIRFGEQTANRWAREAIEMTKLNDHEIEALALGQLF